MPDDALQIIGAGLPRTGTYSLKLALERLTGGRCHHMIEVSERPETVDAWSAAAAGEMPDRDLLGGYTAAVDWPASAFWRGLAAANPDAPVLLSTRSSAERWLRSIEGTIAEVYRSTTADPELARVRSMGKVLARRFCPEWPEREAMLAAYERHNAAVRAEVPPGRLVEWQPGDGWSPLCEALGVAVPDEPFPHVNTTAEFRVMAAIEPAPAARRVSLPARPDGSS